MELNVSVENTHAFVLGGHGDTMVPLPRYSTVAGIPITELMPKDRIDAIVDRTANGGAEIVKLLKTGSAYYAPASAAVEMAESILKDKKKILPCAVYLEGEYGIRDLFIGVPVKLGTGGIEEIIEIKLTDEESKALNHSADAVRTLVEDLARACGTLAHVAALRRTGVGPFTADDLVGLDEVGAAAEAGQAALDALLRPMDEALADWPAVELGAHEAYYLRQGHAVTARMGPLRGQVRLYGAGHRSWV
jgi:hypothetical protein